MGKGSTRTENNVLKFHKRKIKAPQRSYLYLIKYMNHAEAEIESWFAQKHQLSFNYQMA